MVFDNLASALPLIESGKAAGVVRHHLGVRGIAQTPTMNDAVPGFDVTTWFGVLPPASLPDKDAQKYVQAFQTALSEPKYRAQYQKMGIALRTCD